MCFEINTIAILLGCKITCQNNRIFIHFLKTSISKKSHTCEEGGAHPRISVWHLFVDELEKQLFTTKTVGVGQ